MKWYLLAPTALFVLTGCAPSEAPPQAVETESPAAEVLVEAETDLATEQATQSDTPGAEAPPDIATFEGLITSLLQAAQEEDYAEALQFADKALELKPADLSVLAMATQLAQRAGMKLDQPAGDRPASNTMFVRSADFLRQFQATGEKLSEPQLLYARQVFYNEARAHAFDNDNAKALAALADGFAVGFDDFRMIHTDADFAKLRTTPEFKQEVTVRHQAQQRLRLIEVKKQIDSQQPFPFDFSLPSTTGKTVKLGDYKGKVLIVDFWGTWCPPCRREVPHFVELLGKYRDAGLEIVGINYERDDPASASRTINDFVQEYGVTYPCLLGDEATEGRVPDLDSFPTTLFIDPTGKVRLMAVGYHPYEHLEAIVQTLLAETEGSTGGAAEPERQNSHE